MRQSTTSITEAVAELITDNNESKNTQFIGDNQVISKSVTTPRQEVGLSSQPGSYRGLAIFKITITPTKLEKGNMFISNLTPIVTDLGGNRRTMLVNGNYNDYGVSASRILMNDPGRDTWYVWLSDLAQSRYFVSFRIATTSRVSYNVERIA